MKSFTNYAFSSYEDEARKIEFQNDCPHKTWSTKCLICGKYLASDHHITVHTPRGFKNDVSVAIIVSNATQANFERLAGYQKLKLDYDEITILTDSLDSLEMHGYLKPIDQVEMRSLSQEIAHMRKYREKEVALVTLVLYPDTNNRPELEQEAKKLKIQVKIYE